MGQGSDRSVARQKLPIVLLMWFPGRKYAAFATAPTEAMAALPKILGNPARKNPKRCIGRAITSLTGRKCIHENHSGSGPPGCVPRRQESRSKIVATRTNLVLIFGF